MLYNRQHCVLANHVSQDLNVGARTALLLELLRIPLVAVTYPALAMQARLVAALVALISTEGTLLQAPIYQRLEVYLPPHQAHRLR